MGWKKNIVAIIFFMFLLAIGFVSESPSHLTTARFTDSAEMEAGIKLTLGNLDLGLTSDNNSIIEATSGRLKSGMALPSQMLKNEGTLDGKLAYKIIVEGYDGAIQPELSFVIGNERIAGVVNAKGFQFLNGSVGSPLFLKPGESINIIPEIKSASPSSAMGKMTVTISFLMVQSNATEAAEKMLYDKTETKNDIIIQSDDPITSPHVWPTEGWQTSNNSKVKYNISDLTKVQYYGDAANKEGKLSFLDNPVIYLEFPPKKTITIHEKDLEIQGYKLEVVYDDKYSENGRVKIIYSLNRSTDDNLYLIKNVHLRLNYTGGNIPLYSGEIAAKKLMLNTDKPDGLYNTQYQSEFPIYASNASRSFYLSYIKDDYSNDLAQLAKPDINFRNYKMSVVTSEKYLNAEIDYITNSISIFANTSYNQTGDAGTVEILITGNSNEPLIMKRSVKTLRTEKTMIIPEQWVPLSGGVSSCASRLQLNLKTIVKNGIEYLVSDESNPPALYFKNVGSNFFGFQLQGNATEANGIKVKDVVYSSDLSIMKVTFSYSAPKGTSYDGFNIDITNGLHPVVNGSYIQYSNAIQTYSLNVGNETATELIIQSETSEIPEAEGMVAATDEGEIAAIMAEPETIQESQNQTEVPIVESEQSAETPTELLVE